MEKILAMNTKEEKEFNHISTMIGHVLSKNIDFYKDPITEEYNLLNTYTLELKDSVTNEPMFEIKAKIGLIGEDNKVICILSSTVKELEVYHINKIIEGMMEDLMEAIVCHDDGEYDIILSHAIKMLHINTNILNYERSMEE